MERDPDVFLIGEDVGQFGGAFKVTKGFLDKFGPRRVVDTPIAETGFTGLAAGAALVGLRPVVEFQFADFISCAFDPIINVLARHHWRTGDAMPVTMRAPFGARLRAGPTHSQSVESYFAHVPGPQDRDAGHARGRRRAADQLDPGQQPHAVPGEQVPLPAAAGAGPAVARPDPVRGGQGRARGPRRHARSRTRRASRRASRWPRSWTRTASRSRSSTCARWCRWTSRRSSTRCARPRARWCCTRPRKRLGYGAEIAATIQEECFWHLDQPVVRIAAKNTPTPDQPTAGGRGDPAARGDRRDAAEGGEGLRRLGR